MVDTRAFDLQPDSFDGKRAALLLHGFTGTPYEMRPIAEALVRRGYRCVGPVMAGHGATHVELAGVHWRDWIDVAAGHLEALRGEVEQVVVAGMSMGGLVTLALGASHSPVAIASMGAPLWLARKVRWQIPLGKFLRPVVPKSEGPDIREPGARERHPGMEAIPIAATHEVLKLQRHVRGIVADIVCPTFIAHGAHDETANPRDAYTIFGEVSAGARELFIGTRSGHVISVDYDGEECARRMGAFFDGAIQAAPNGKP